MLIVFQYQPGPFSSYREMTSIETPGEDAKIGGRPITGVFGPSGWVKSTTLRAPESSAAMRSVRMGMVPLINGETNPQGRWNESNESHERCRRRATTRGSARLNEKKTRTNLPVQHHRTKRLRLISFDSSDSFDRS